MRDPLPLLHKEPDSIRNKKDIKYNTLLLATSQPFLSPSTLYPYWQYHMRNISLQSRMQLFAHLRMLSPSLVTLGGEKGIREAIYAIQNVIQWWP